MPDLKAAATHAFWSNFQDPDVYRAIAFLEGVEDWTLDTNPEVEDALEDLGHMLDKIGTVDLNQEQNLVYLGAYIKTGTILRILMCMDQAYPGSASKVLAHAEQNTQGSDDISGIFLARNIAFERLRLLSRIFSSERIETVQKALENYHD